MDAEPIAVALKFGFLAVLYLFLLWVARSALKDLRRGAGVALETGLYTQAGRASPAPAPEAWLVAESGDGLRRGDRYDLFGGVTLGRSEEADLQLDDPYASTIHARVHVRRGAYYVEDMNSTNGTLLNGRPLEGDAPLQPGDVIRIGDTELRYEA